MTVIENTGKTDIKSGDNSLVSRRLVQSKEIFKKCNISYDLATNVFVLKGKYYLSMTDVLGNEDSYSVLLAFLVCNMLKKRYEELDLHSLIIMLLGDKCIKSKSLVQFCLVLMNTKYNGEKFIKSLLIAMGYSKDQIKNDIVKIISIYV